MPTGQSRDWEEIRVTPTTCSFPGRASFAGYYANRSSASLADHASGNLTRSKICIRVLASGVHESALELTGITFLHAAFRYTDFLRDGALVKRAFRNGTKNDGAWARIDTEEYCFAKSTDRAVPYRPECWWIVGASVSPLSSSLRRYNIRSAKPVRITRTTPHLFDAAIVVEWVHEGWVPLRRMTAGNTSLRSTQRPGRPNSLGSSSAFVDSGRESRKAGPIASSSLRKQWFRLDDSLRSFVGTHYINALRYSLSGKEAIPVPMQILVPGDHPRFVSGVIS
ncbi:hypothetical protein F5141DRAFT_1064313 [Pisolithus sp. B1]|nr:hypothetical protein F5141DRAFT_1064313 [Pisolithus sp. B1]